MKALILLRHAESGEKMQGQSDHERTLTARGVKQSVSAGNYLHIKELRPDIIIASDAIRVQSTLDHVIKNLHGDVQVMYSPGLYEADASGYMEAVRNAPDCQILLVAGHNPGISAFASNLSKTRVSGMNTGDLMVFHFKEGAWSKLDKAKCELMEHFVP